MLMDYQMEFMAVGRNLIIMSKRPGMETSMVSTSVLVNTQRIVTQEFIAFCSSLLASRRDVNGRAAKARAGGVWLPECEIPAIYQIF